jgi:D-alanine-D-alanine ligase
MVSPSVPDLLIRPPKTPSTRILFIARHAPEAPGYACRSFPGDGGYPAYYHRVWQVLSALGYGVRTASRCHALLDAAGTVDLVFSLYNRMPIENPEVFITSLCTFLRIPCLGAGPNIRALAEDKWLSKLTARAIGLPVAEGVVYASAPELAVPPAFPGPYFVKNRFGAASEGITAESIQDDWAGAARVARGLLKRGLSVLVEAYVPGLDLTVPVLGGKQPILLGVVQPGSDKAGGIITEDLKRDDPLGYRMFEAGPLDAAVQDDVTALWATAGPMDYFRLDYRFDPQSGRRVFLEFNICCHIGRSGAICLAAAQWGLDQADVLGHVVEYSLRRQAARSNQEARPWAL